VGIGVVVSVKTGRGVEVGGKGVGTDPVEGDWQAKIRKEARVVIHKRRTRSFISAFLFMDYSAKSKCLESVIIKHGTMISLEGSPNG